MPTLVLDLDALLGAAKARTLRTNGDSDAP